MERKEMVNKWKFVEQKMSLNRNLYSIATATTFRIAYDSD